MKKLLSYITILFCILFNSTFAEEIKEETVIIENNEPLVSVIMPVYNAENFLDKSVSSVINQTYKNLEILLIDDCSTDNSYNILKEYANKDNRIKLFHNEQNKHVSATRNVGIKNATGKYLYFIDSDDFIDNDYIEHLVKTAEKENADIVVNTNIYNIYNNQPSLSYFSREMNRRIFDDKKVLAVKIFPSVWNRLFKRELQTKYNILFPDGIKHLEDAYFNATFFSVANNISFIKPNSYYHYRRGLKNSVTQTLFYKLSLNDALYVIKNGNKFLKDNDLLKHGYIANILSLENILFNSKQYMTNKNEIKTSNEDFAKVRELLLSLKDDILNNKSFYQAEELDFLSNIEKYSTYDDYAKHYKVKEIIRVTVVSVLFMVFLLLVPYILYIFYQIYKDFKKGINPFKNNIFNKVNKNE